MWQRPLWSCQCPSAGNSPSYWRPPSPWSKRIRRRENVTLSQKKVLDLLSWSEQNTEQLYIRVPRPLIARKSFSLLLILPVPSHAPLPGLLLHPPLEAGHHGLNVLHQPGLVSRQFLLKISPDFLKPLESPCFIFRLALYLNEDWWWKLLASPEAKWSDFIN